MRKILSFVVVLLALVTMVACGDKSAKKEKETTAGITTITNTTTGQIVTVAPTTAKTTTVKATTVAPTTAKATTVKATTVAPTTAKATTVKATTVAPTTAKTTTVKATTAKATTAQATTTAVQKPKLYVVGDSTVCDFGTTDATYYYPRYGYGTQLVNFFNGIDVVNLALSGRSSKSFTTEGNYQTLCNNIKAGDYLLIGFGHNDEKFEKDRYTNASAPITDSTSFQYSLYENYIKVAEDKGATAVLCTPIVRRSTSNDYTGSNGHIVAGQGEYEGGNYTQAIIDLGTSKNVTVLNLTARTQTLYTELGAAETVNLHAWTNEKEGSVDNTHTNIYGAKYNAYLIADELLKSTSSLKNYLNTSFAAPTKANDLISNPSFVARPYTGAWTPSTNWTTIKSPWYGTGFGDTGGSVVGPNFSLTQTDSTYNITVLNNKGKMGGSSDGFAFIFQQLDYNIDFKLSATATVNAIDNTNSQVSFGLMIRDDIYIDLRDASIKSNYLAAGACKYALGTGGWVNFGRISTTAVGLGTGLPVPQVEQSIDMSIEKTGTSIKLTYGGVTSTYVDFDLRQIDTEHMFVGMYAARNINVDFTNVVFVNNGTSQEA